jgi:hypothetical protein
MPKPAPIMSHMSSLGNESYKRYITSEKGRLKKKEVSARFRANRRSWYNSLKTGPCSMCGNSYPACVMDWHHKGSNKLFNPSRSVQFAKERVLAEIEKCELLCANCHRIRTWTNVDV